ncbi:MAG: hypothetical protein ACI9Y1_003384 [Lentisphaeria bacterium]|jgi:hypothetical protein
MYLPSRLSMGTPMAEVVIWVKSVLEQKDHPEQAYRV